MIDFVKEHIVYRFCIPQTITTDQGTMFTSGEFDEFAIGMGIKVLNSSPYYVSVFPHGGSHKRVNLYACSLSQMVMRKDTRIYPGSGKSRPYVQRGRRVCIILHLGACTGVNTSVVFNEMECGSSTAYECCLD